MDDTIVVYINLRPYRVLVLPRIGEWVLIDGVRLVVKEIQHSLNSFVTHTDDSAFEATEHSIDIKLGR